MSRILCVIDGMTDPFFDVSTYPFLASFPKREYIKTIPQGFDAETLPCILSLLGIKSQPSNIRGWIEALGADISVNSDDLIFRVTWAELDECGVCAGFRKAPTTIPTLKHARYYSLGSYQGLLVLPGQGIHIVSSQTIPPYEMLGKNISYFTLPNIPALNDAFLQMNSAGSNCIMLPWAASVAGHLPCFPQKAAVVTGTNVVKGIAKALSMKLVTSRVMTGDIDSNLELKVQTTLDLAKVYPFVMLHIGGCDEASHRKNKREKDLFLRKVDTVVLQTLLRSNFTVEAASDHGCNPVTGRHMDEVQPYFSRQI